MPRSYFFFYIEWSTNSNFTLFELIQWCIFVKKSNTKLKLNLKLWSFSYFSVKKKRISLEKFTSRVNNFVTDRFLKSLEEDVLLFHCNVWWKNHLNGFMKKSKLMVIVIMIMTCCKCYFLWRRLNFLLLVFLFILTDTGLITISTVIYSHHWFKNIFLAYNLIAVINTKSLYILE